MKCKFCIDNNTCDRRFCFTAQEAERQGVDWDKLTDETWSEVHARVDNVINAKLKNIGAASTTMVRRKVVN